MKKLAAGRSDSEQQQQVERSCLSENDFRRMRAELVTVIAQQDQLRTSPDSEIEEIRGRFMATELQVQQQAKLVAQSKRIIADLEQQLAASIKEGQQLKMECHTLKTTSAPQLEDLQRLRKEAASELDAKQQELLKERAARTASEKLLTERDDELQLVQLENTQVKLDADERVEAMRKQLVHTCAELDAAKKEAHVLKLVAADKDQLFSNQKAQLQDKDDKFELLRSELERLRSERVGVDVDYSETRQSLQRAEAHIEMLQQQVHQSKHSAAKKQDVLGAIGEHLRKAAGLENQPEPEAEVDEDEVLKLFYSSVDKLTDKQDNSPGNYDEDAVQKVLSAAAAGPQADASAKAAMVALFAGTPRSSGAKGNTRLSAAGFSDATCETPASRRLPGQRREALSVITTAAMEQAIEQLAVAHEANSPKNRNDDRGQRKILRRTPSTVKKYEVPELQDAAEVQEAESVVTDEAPAEGRGEIGAVPHVPAIVEAEKSYSDSLLPDQPTQVVTAPAADIAEEELATKGADAATVQATQPAGVGRHSIDYSDVDKGFESDDAFPMDGPFTLDLQAARDESARPKPSGKRASATSDRGSILSAQSFSSQRFTLDLTDFYDLDSPRAAQIEVICLSPILT
mmetsp:Transcript_53637/g.99172  ORF Transcript_53637/g.99172 Transcript_53637/m.99172 type:complete len:630 (+) Transcript_53637:42-1931(+)